MSGKSCRRLSLEPPLSPRLPSNNGRHVEPHQPRINAPNATSSLSAHCTLIPPIHSPSKLATESQQNVVIENRSTPGRASDGHQHLSVDYSPARRLSAEPEPFDLSAKVMLIGDSGVGKTCLLVRFKDGHFLSGNFISTVGIDFRNKVVTVDDTKIKLQIWDTAGQERFRSVTHAYYRDANALLLLYDVTSKTSFDNIRAWLGEIHEYAQDDVVIMLLGNKADCNSERTIRREDGERLGKEYNATFMETSAKTGMNVELAFMAVARELVSRKVRVPGGHTFNVKAYVESQSQKPGCNCAT